MPKKKQEGYENALGSVFDFIFANNKKPSKPLRRRPTGIAGGSDEFSRALTELAMNPALYANDAAINSLNETFLNGIKFAEFKLDKDENLENKYRSADPDASRFRVRASEIGKAFSDPNKFIDGIQKKAKEDRKLRRMTGAAAALDSAIAVGLGLKAGMSTKDALTFGKAARMAYDESTRAEHKSLLASNTAIKAQIELARQKAISEGINPNEARFATRVEELVRSNRDSIKKDQKALEKAMRTSRQDFVGSPDYEAMASTEVARAIQEFRKNNPNMEPGKALKAEEAIAENIAKNVEDRYKDALSTTHRDKVRRELIQEYGSSPDGLARVDALMGEFDKNVSRSQTYGSGMSGYRLTYAENQALLASLTNNKALQDQHNQAANMALAWERLKGSGEFAGSDIGNAIKAVKDDIKSVKADIDSLEALSARTPDQERRLSLLKAHQKKLGIHQGKLSQLNTKENQRINKSGDYWRNPNVGFARSKDVKFAKEAAQERIGLEITNLQLDLNSTTDLFERQRLTSEISRLQAAQKQIMRIPGTEFRSQFDTWLITARTFNSQVLKGGIGGGLINGTAFFTDASGASAPGQLAWVSHT